MSQFDAARRNALMGDLLRQLAGQPTRLLPFDEVKDSLRLRHLVDRGLKEVPLAKIAGTLGRGREFNRVFLPKKESLRERWQTIEQLAEGPRGFPPVDLYQVSDVYFVVDGHHRVSVLRSMGAPSVEARVKEFLTPVALEADASIEEVLQKRGLADFLEATALVPGEPGELAATICNAYERLLEHIRVHRWYRSVEESREIPWGEAARLWYADVYRPVVEIVRRSGAVRAFPGRTETDLYLFTMDHLHELRQLYGSEVPPERAVEEVAERRRRQRGKLRGILRGRREEE